MNVLWLLTMTISRSLHPILVKKGLKHVPPFQALALTSIPWTLILILWAYYKDQLSISAILSVPPISITYFTLIGSFGAISSLALFNSIQLFPIPVVMGVLQATPVITAVLSIFIFEEQLSFIQVVAGGIIILASFALVFK